MSHRMVAWTAATLLALAAGAARAQPDRGGRGLLELSLEQLSNVTVTSVSRREESLARAAASVYVITAEDIRRSGATTLPEALRLAPNLQVARVDSGQYAITARGFNSTIANKLLVLLDGRTVYTPLFSGTFWEVQDVLLEDVERIEVISGPGATLWGANAVNGVINVITRPARETQGSYATAGAGSDERLAALRHGGTSGETSWRVYAKAREHDATELADGRSVDDAAEHAQAGFRADWARGADGLTLQGDAYAGEIDQATEPRELGGINLLARWTRELGAGAGLRVQAYYDRSSRHHPDVFKEDLDTFDLELQHALAPRGDHRVMWGAGLRRHHDHVENSAQLAFLPASRDLNQAHVFVQDEIHVREALHLTVGMKAERNSYTGTEILPNARLGLQFDRDHLVWVAASRAVRAPSRLDRELFIPGTVAGGPEFRSEVAKVLELGYRGQPTPRLAVSATAFYQDYEDLRSLAPGPDGAVVANDLRGSVSGIEAWATWRGGDWWRLSGGLVTLDKSLRLAPGAVDLQGDASIGADPDEWWKLRASFDLAGSTQLDLMARGYAALDTRDVPAYTALDARLAWSPRRGVELSLLLENLLDDAHLEWQPGAEFGRAAFLRLRLSL